MANDEFLVWSPFREQLDGWVFTNLTVKFVLDIAGVFRAKSDHRKAQVRAKGEICDRNLNGALNFCTGGLACDIAELPLYEVVFERRFQACRGSRDQPPPVELRVLIGEGDEAFIL